MTVIFSTIHGSRLYGLDHADSDYDTYTVVTNDHDFSESGLRRGQHVRSFADGPNEDDVVVTLNEFLKRVGKGSHQACEALFSQEKVLGEGWVTWGPLLNAVRITSPDAFYAYERTIRKFAFGDFKRRRHAIRLAGDLWYLRMWGEFNPRMTQAEVQYATRLAEVASGNALLRRLDIPPSDG